MSRSMVAGIGSATRPSAWNATELSPRTERAATLFPRASNLFEQADGTEELRPSADYLNRAGSDTPEPAPPTGKPEAAPAGDPPSAQAEGKPTVGHEELSKEEQQQVQKLRARDAEVRAHEAAHLAAGGAHVRGGASYSYQQGPDGKQYAVGGEVSIDVSAVPNDPQATIQKMQQVRAAALAPASPSGADRSVASAASQTEMKARQQLAERSARAYEAHSGGNGGTGGEGQAMDGTAKSAGAQTTQRSIEAWA